MPDDYRKLTISVPAWLVELADLLVGCVFLEPHPVPGRINHVLLFNRAAALTHLAGRGAAHVEATIRGQIERERSELEGWKTIQRLFARDRRTHFVKKSDPEPEDHEALAIVDAWSDEEDDEGSALSEVGHSLEALERTLHLLQAAADALKRTRAQHVPAAAA